MLHRPHFVYNNPLCILHIQISCNYKIRCRYRLVIIPLPFLFLQALLGRIRRGDSTHVAGECLKVTQCLGATEGQLQHLTIVDDPDHIFACYIIQLYEDHGGIGGPHTIVNLKCHKDWDHCSMIKITDFK